LYRIDFNLKFVIGPKKDIRSFSKHYYLAKILLLVNDRQIDGHIRQLITEFVRHQNYESLPKTVKRKFFSQAFDCAYMYIMYTNLFERICL
jgi:hypothetical protein